MIVHTLRSQSCCAFHPDWIRQLLLLLLEGLAARHILHAPIVIAVGSGEVLARSRTTSFLRLAMAC